MKTRRTILSALVDVNVVLPLLIPQHVAHAATRAWLATQHDSSVHWAWPTQLGVLRLLSQPSVMGPDALTPERALQVWDALISATGMQQAPPVPASHGGHMRRLVRGRSAAPNLWADAWLAALALSLDFEMVTFDNGFRSFKSLKLRLLRR